MNVIARLHHRHERGEVGVGPAVRLDVGELAAEELLGAVDGEVLDLVVDTRTRRNSARRDTPRRICWSARCPPPP